LVVVLLPLPPVVPVLGVVGAGAGIGLGLGLVVVLPDMPPLVEPPVVAPAPAPARWSRRHVSRSRPVRATHLAGTSVVAPVALSLEPVLLPLALGVLLPLALGVLLSLEPVALPPADAPPLTLEPDVVPLAPVEPDAEPEDWAIATEDRARRAAAVAAVSVFNIMMRDLLEIAGVELPPPCTQALCPECPCPYRAAGEGCLIYTEQLRHRSGGLPDARRSRNSR
jgi:hypothetical protein